MNVSTLQPSSQAIQKLHQLESELNDRFLERNEAIRTLLLSVLTRQHTLIFGKQGSGKSDLIQSLANALKAGLFRIQLGQNSLPDHVFGPIKISELQKDRLVHASDNYLPGNPFVFLDEIDKASPAIKSSLYTAMEERLYNNDGVIQTIPLVSLFGGANFIEEFQTPSLAALFDRFMFRIEVDWIEADANFLTFVDRVADDDHPQIAVALSLQELEELQKAVKAVVVPNTVREAIAKLRKNLQREGIQLSTRRWGYVITVLKAIAFIEGDTQVWEEHFRSLKPVLWSHKNEIPVIDGVLKGFKEGLSDHIQTMLRTAKGVVTEALQDQNPATQLGRAASAQSDLVTLKSEFESIAQRATGQRLAKVNKAIKDLDKELRKLTERYQSVGIS